jgi:hypothetical protein
MERLRTESLRSLQAAAHERGYVEVNESTDGTVLWLRKSAPGSARDTHQRMCIDSLTNSATVFWMSVPTKLNSKTFRDVPALEEWFVLQPEPVLER